MTFELHIRTPEEIAAERANAQAEAIRAERDHLLAESDWVVIRAQETGETIPQEWRDYRQALRDVPSQPGFPGDVMWPDAPA